MFMHADDAKIIYLTDNIYPAKLKVIPKPPEKLFYRGNISARILEKKILGVVGSRKMTEYAKSCLKHIFSDLSIVELATISGFMTGVDTEAHKLSIERGIQTIAVLPCGIDFLHPLENAGLYQQILDNNGLVMSEYEGRIEPKKWTYPQRNRIIAALCDALLVAQAGAHSGSLITAYLAKKYNKPVLVIPGNIFAKDFDGSLQLLIEFAKTVSSGLHINNILNLTLLPNAKEELYSEGLNETEKIVYNKLMGCPANTDDLCYDLNLSVSTISTVLTTLVVKGLIAEDKGSFYAC